MIIRATRLWRPTITIAAVIGGMTVAPACAQLIGNEIRGDQRICTYVGSPTVPNDTLDARTVTLAVGQECPVAAPYVDPDAPIPSNAALRSETTSATNRFCIYEQGGVSYQVTVEIEVRCAMTPALLERDQQQRRDRQQR
ncbi:hypothetical protein SAMN05216382_3129 [Sphingomonas palmae]|uniref:Uncharacterized protein n=2 Tax=Sphingomonas palmae TaxID=1855283 RepID=A0A1H7UZ81_9SPHN|nr:hypothetical protein SAMN05216382_3129 [Sphingomonas palmae]